MIVQTKNGKNMVSKKFILTIVLLILLSSTSFIYSQKTKVETLNDSLNLEYVGALHNNELIIKRILSSLKEHDGSIDYWDFREKLKIYQNCSLIKSYKNRVDKLNRFPF